MAQQQKPQQTASEQKQDLKQFTSKAQEVYSLCYRQDGSNLLTDVLPAQFKHMADRFVKRAFYYIKGKKYLWDATSSSIRDCILAAAEVGLCLDGKVAHAVTYSNKKKDPNTNREVWVKEAQMIPDYKGILAVARRHKVIVDAWAAHVHEHDVYDVAFEDNEWKVTYKPGTTNRGAYIGTLCVLIFEGNRVQPTFMTKAEIDGIKARTKSRDSHGNIVGPWITDEGEMQKKTTYRRALKPYVDDPEVLALLEAEEVLDVIDSTAEEVATAPAPGLSRTQQARHALAASRGLPAPQERMDFSMMGGDAREHEYAEVDELQQERSTSKRSVEKDHGSPTTAEAGAQGESAPQRGSDEIEAEAHKALTGADDLPNLHAAYDTYFSPDSNEGDGLSQEAKDRLTKLYRRLQKSFEGAGKQKGMLPE